MAAIDWYGPLVDISQAASHICEYVQLLVFVHRSRPIQRYKKPRGGGLLKTDVQVGDDTRPFFSVSIWHKHMASKICAGDIVLLQNVKIVEFGDALEASTVHCSSLLQLIHPFELLASKSISCSPNFLRIMGSCCLLTLIILQPRVILRASHHVDELLGQCLVGRTSKDKLKKVICWVQKTGSMLDDAQRNHVLLGKNFIARKNWKSQEERKTHDCQSISEVLSILGSCSVNFHACIGEIFLPSKWKHNEEFEVEKLFISKRLSIMADNNLVEDLTCTGCKSCGSPIDSWYAHATLPYKLTRDYSRSSSGQNTVPLYCQKSSNHVHNISLIYRPFLLYVWDHTEHIPLLVKNKAAELLFGNIAAEDVYAYYHGHGNQNLASRENSSIVSHSEADWELQAATTQSWFQHLKRRNATGDSVIPNLHGIWLILLKTLLLQGKNSPLRFGVAVDNELDEENGRFELINLTMPCYEGHASVV